MEPILKITRELVDNGTVSEQHLHEFFTEASDLRWPVGLQIPHQLETELGNGQPFILRHLNHQSAVYFQGNGCITLTIFND